jgi:hypothetical protein
MRKKDFDNLVGSIRQAGKIKRGEMEASRDFRFDPARALLKIAAEKPDAVIEALSP